MTSAANNPPTKIAKQLSHHVKPSVTKLATVAHVAGYTRSLSQYKKNVCVFHVLCSRGDGSMSLFDHTCSGAMQLSCLGRTQDEVDVSRSRTRSDRPGAVRVGWESYIAMVRDVCWVVGAYIYRCRWTIRMGRT
jgi:hypothetical protein